MGGTRPGVGPVPRGTGGVLPIEGRKGRSPSWPFEDDPTDAEKRRWRRLWKLPQAVMWEQLAGTELVVGRIVKLALAAEAGDATAAMLSELRQLEDRCGLSPLALARLRWTFGDAAERRRAAAPPGRKDWRSLRVVAND